MEISDFLPKTQALSDELTERGLEVESCTDFRNQFQNIVIGQLLSVEKHKNADRLTVCKVSIGKEEKVIVCGAKNHKVGDKVALALPGAVLPGDIKIQMSQIRGIESEGMLVSSLELGLEKESEGILILNQEAPVGERLSKFWNQEDILLEVNVTPNRSDCLSHFGLAREISCILNRPLQLQKQKQNLTKGFSVRSDISVRVDEPSSCPRYGALLIRGVTIGESPDWLKNQLQFLGLKPINNVVDVTNYVLMELGQPLHAFDRDRLTNISVGFSQPKEQFQALDDSFLELTGKELVIQSAGKTQALAGVIGGKHSAISRQTKNILLESAYFRPEEVRRSSRRFGLNTESSHRFSRGTDPETVLPGLMRAGGLIQELAGGDISEDVYDECKQSYSPRTIAISKEDIDERLGLSVDSKSFISWMRRLGCHLKEKKNHFFVTPPSFRSDLMIPEDLIEEFARLKGYNHIPETLPKIHVEMRGFNKRFVQESRVRDFLSSSGWHESIHYSFSDPKLYENFLGGSPDLSHLGLGENTGFPLQNPISQSLSFMKPLLAPDLLQSVLRNMRHGQKWGRLFEINPVFSKKANQYLETHHLSFASWGRPLDIWSKNADNNEILFFCKSQVENLLRTERISKWSWVPVIPKIPLLHPKQALGLQVEKELVGCLGTLHPQWSLNYKLQIPIVLGEFQLSKIQNPNSNLRIFKEISSLPDVERDLTFQIPKDLPVRDVQVEILRILKTYCRSVRVVDIYTKGDKRSVSFRIFLKPEGKKSFTDKELQEFQNQVISGLKEKFSITLG